MGLPVVTLDIYVKANSHTEPIQWWQECSRRPHALGCSLLWALGDDSVPSHLMCSPRCSSMNLSERRTSSPQSQRSHHGTWYGGWRMAPARKIVSIISWSQKVLASYIQCNAGQSIVSISIRVGHTSTGKLRVCSALYNTLGTALHSCTLG